MAGWKHCLTEITQDSSNETSGVFHIVSISSSDLYQGTIKMDPNTQIIMDGGGVGLTAQPTTTWWPGMPTTLDFIPTASSTEAWSPILTTMVVTSVDSLGSLPPIASLLTYGGSPASMTIAISPTSIPLIPSITPSLLAPSRIISSKFATTTSSTNTSLSQPAETSSVAFGLSQQFVVIGSCILGFVIITGLVFTYLACTGSSRKERRITDAITGRVGPGGKGDAGGRVEAELEKGGYKEEDLEEIRSEMPTFMLYREGPHLGRSNSRSSVWTGPITVASESQESLARQLPSAARGMHPAQTPRSKSKLGHISMPRPTVNLEKKRYTFSLRRSGKEANKKATSDGKASARASIETFTSSVAAGLSPFHQYAQIARAGERTAFDPNNGSQAGGRAAQHAPNTLGHMSRESVHPGDVYVANRPGSTISAYSQATAHKHATRYGMGDSTRFQVPSSPVPTINVQLFETVASKLNKIGQKYQQQGQQAGRGDQHDPLIGHAKISPEGEHCEMLDESPDITSSAERKRTPTTPSRSMPTMTDRSSAYQGLTTSPTSKSLPVRHVKSILKRSRVPELDMDVGTALCPSDSYKSLWEAAVGYGSGPGAKSGAVSTGMGGNRQTLAGTIDIGIMMANGMELSPETIRRRESLMSSYYYESGPAIRSGTEPIPDLPRVNPLNLTKSIAKPALPPIITTTFPAMIHDRLDTQTGLSNNTARPGNQVRESVGYKRVMSVYAGYEVGQKNGHDVYDT